MSWRLPSQILAAVAELMGALSLPSARRSLRPPADTAFCMDHADVRCRLKGGRSVNTRNLFRFSGTQVVVFNKALSQDELGSLALSTAAEFFASMIMVEGVLRASAAKQQKSFLEPLNGKQADEQQLKRLKVREQLATLRIGRRNCSKRQQRRLQHRLNLGKRSRQAGR